MAATTSLVYKPLLSIEETAILLGETRSTLYRAVKQPDFPLLVHRIGKRLRIPRRAVERLRRDCIGHAGVLRALECSRPWICELLDGLVLGSIDVPESEPPPPRAQRLGIEPAGRNLNPGSFSSTATV